MKTLVTLIAMLAMTGCATTPADPIEAKCREEANVRVSSPKTTCYSSGTRTSCYSTNYRDVFSDEVFQICMRDAKKEAERQEFRDTYFK